MIRTAPFLLIGLIGLGNILVEQPVPYEWLSGYTPNEHCIHGTDGFLTFGRASHSMDSWDFVPVYWINSTGKIGRLTDFYKTDAQGYITHNGIKWKLTDVYDYTSGFFLVDSISLNWRMWYEQYGDDPDSPPPPIRSQDFNVPIFKSADFNLDGIVDIIDVIDFLDVWVNQK